MDEKHIADYFIISGISQNESFDEESKQLISPKHPITDITVIFKNLGEQCPAGYHCIETTPGGHSADLNNGNLFKSQNILICYRRGNDKPPLVEVGVIHEEREQALPDVEIVYTTPYGRSANTGNSGSRSGTYITYRRSKTISPINQLVVVDLCVILNNKNEHPPHAFYPIRKNLNKSYYGMIGCEVFLCYKKTLLSPPSISYKPKILSRFPLDDYRSFPLPDTVPLFCLPAGANIELWPSNCQLSRPTISTFVLTSDSAQKMYGSSYSFHELYDQNLLTQDQKIRLGITDSTCNTEDSQEGADASASAKECDETSSHQTYVTKSICILSRWPFFDCFEKFLQFLHRIVFNPRYNLAHSTSSNSVGSPTSSSSQISKIPIEHYISHFLLDVSFPTPQRPTVLVQLMPGSDETLTISQPSSRLPLPLNGASFCHLLTTLGVTHSMNLLLFGLTEQKILLHSLEPSTLTAIAEALTTMMFPFYWQCPYVPLCPLSLHGILNAPLPFIVGIDSRCFDTFSPPSDIICIDLDTQSIYLSELKKCLNLRILPKRPARILKSSLDKIYQRLVRFQALSAANNHSPMHRSEINNKKNIEKQFELDIQEAFLRFMATILRGFRSYLLPITQAPTIGATDPTSLFDFESFLASRDRNYGQFYHLITKTQMFTHYIEERSFVSAETSTSLAFFDDCEEKLVASGDMYSDKPIKLFDNNISQIQSDRSVFIPAPDHSPSVSLQPSSPKHNGQTCSVKSDQAVSTKTINFGPLDSSLFHRHPQASKLSKLDQAQLEDKTNLVAFDPSGGGTFSISRRTKQEVKTSQKLAKRSSENPIEWSKYLLSSCYSLWFSLLPSYVVYCDTMNKMQTNDSELIDKCTSRILRYAYSNIVRMQKLNLLTDEVCFRVLTLLCGHYGQPALAVRVFFEMKKAGIKPNAVTYGYYNKAVLESRWPDHSIKPTTVLWIKMRNVISGIALFKSHGKIGKAKRDKLNCMSLITKGTNLASANEKLKQPVDEVDRAPKQANLIEMMPKDELEKSRPSTLGQHRRSLVNRSFSSFLKTETKETSLIDLTQSNPKTPNTTMTSSSQTANIGPGPAKTVKHRDFRIHKSQSMHLRETGDLMKSESSSFEDELDQSTAKPQLNDSNIMQATNKSKQQKEPMRQKFQPQAQRYSTDEKLKCQATELRLYLFASIQDRFRLLSKDSKGLSDTKEMKGVDNVESPAGLLFNTNRDTLMATLEYQSSQSAACNKANYIGDDDDIESLSVHHNVGVDNRRKSADQQQPTLLSADSLQADSSNIQQLSRSLVDLTHERDLPGVSSITDETHNEIQNELKNNDYDDEISATTNATDNERDYDHIVQVDPNYNRPTHKDVDHKDDNNDDDYDDDDDDDDDDSMDDDEDDSDSEESQQRGSLLKNLTSTPNFKLSSLINYDSSNLNWPKWTSSNSNTKNVYKGIKSAASGLVTSLQEIKSSFSLPANNNATISESNGQQTNQDYPQQLQQLQLQQQQQQQQNQQNESQEYQNSRQSFSQQQTPVIQNNNNSINHHYNLAATVSTTFAEAATSTTTIAVTTNNATISNRLPTAKSVATAATRDLLSNWAQYFTSIQGTNLLLNANRSAESYYYNLNNNNHNHNNNNNNNFELSSENSSSLGESSNDIFKLSRDEDFELEFDLAAAALGCLPSVSGQQEQFGESNINNNANYNNNYQNTRQCFALFDSLEKHYANTKPSVELSEHLLFAAAATASGSLPSALLGMSLEQLNLNSINNDNQSSAEAGAALDNNNDHGCHGSPAAVAMEISLSTCSRCNVCKSLLYDEEIMERWTHYESNLNTKCVYCRAKIVPLMSVLVDDRRPLMSGKSHQRTTTPEAAKNTFTSSPREPSSTFIVPYLSPIVLRKELESVFESSSDIRPATGKFVDEHPILYWNLLWYMTRINVPTHLPMLLLECELLNPTTTNPSSAQDDVDKQDYVDEQPSQERCRRKATTSARGRVVVRTFWDDEKLHAPIGPPLYKLHKRGNPSKQVDAILCDRLHLSTGALDVVIDLIKANQLHQAMNLILNARLKSAARFCFDKNRHNLYRDIMFLTIQALRGAKFSKDNFEREYRKAFESLNFQQVALNRFDRPPTIGSLCCRKCFKELELPG